MSMIPVSTAALMGAPTAYQVNRAYQAYRRTRPYSRGAMAMGKFAYSHRKDIAFLAKKLGKAKAFKRAQNVVNKRRTAAKIGEDVGQDTARTSRTVDESSVNKNTRQLYTNNILDIDRGTGLHERLRDIIHVKGFKVCMEVKSNTGTVSSGNELLFNLALICPKGQETVDVTDFFRDHHSDRRNQDFSVGLTSTEFHCLPINSDKYHILMHKRYRLGDSLNDHNPSYKFIQEWIPINRQFRYVSGESAGNEQVNNYDKIYLVYWADVGMADSASLSLSNAMTVTNHGVLYWKDVCQC